MEQKFPQVKEDVDMLPRVRMCCKVGKEMYLQTHLDLRLDKNLLLRFVITVSRSTLILVEILHPMFIIYFTNSEFYLC